jgi:hypothetical protein
MKAFIFDSSIFGLGARDAIDTSLIGWELGKQPIYSGPEAASIRLSTMCRRSAELSDVT